MGELRALHNEIDKNCGFLDAYSAYLYIEVEYRDAQSTIGLNGRPGLG
jgi:hypothetical protein